MITLKLTPAQVSALECAGLGYDSEPLTHAAWDGGHKLTLPKGKTAREELASEINELSNSEDALAQEKRGTECAPGARGAALALANLYLKVLKHA